MTRELRHRVGNALELAVRDRDVPRDPAVYLEAWRTIVRAGSVGLLERLGVVANHATRSRCDRLGHVAEADLLRTREVVGLAVMPRPVEQHRDRGIGHVVARDGRGTTVAGRSGDQAFRADPSVDQRVEVQVVAKEHQPDSAAANVLLRLPVVAGEREGGVRVRATER